LARSLSATLRIPSDRLQSAIEELKTLGTLTDESENSRDTTSGYTDVVARLSNARRTEQRLLGLLSERAGKLGEVVQVEKEIGEVRERIERMEAQQRGLQNQVQFATIRLELTEEGQSQYAGLRTRVRTAFTYGYRNAISTALDLTLGALRYGPSVVVYGVLLCPFIIVAYRRRGPRRMAS
jgi:chromosome segregation ATPase